jgi:hypothetical protein
LGNLFLKNVTCVNSKLFDFFNCKLDKQIFYRTGEEVLNIFFLIPARNSLHVHEKIEEVKSLGFQYAVVCGEKMDLPNVIYQPPNGKYAAINFGVNLVPKDTDIVVLNDVDNKIHNLNFALNHFQDKKVALVFTTEKVREGPQRLFLKILNTIRKRIPIATGGLMLIRSSELNRITPLRPCKAEDTYILFKVIENMQKTVFCGDCYAETDRTKWPEQEEDYKRRTVTGIYQALSFTKPILSVRLFYYALPIFSPLLLFFGKNGYYWVRGILLGISDYIQGDRTGIWKATPTSRVSSKNLRKP